MFVLPFVYASLVLGFAEAGPSCFLATVPFAGLIPAVPYLPHLPFLLLLSVSLPVRSGPFSSCLFRQLSGTQAGA